MSVRVGIVDSGVSPAQAAAVVASVGIVTHGALGTTRLAAVDDPVGHGTAVVALLLAQAPMARLFSAQAFADGCHADAACVADGIIWCLEHEVRVINLSLGLVVDHDVLRQACAVAVARGTILVAAFPARGGSVYPAAYPGVVAVSGDARCNSHTWSVIEPGRLYGAAPLAADGVTSGGASYAAARVSGLAAGFVALWPDAQAADFREWLSTAAEFRGRERRQPVRAG
jgi:hypothetical protein